MNALKQRTQRLLSQVPMGARCLNDRPYRTLVLAVVSLILNLGFAFYYGILGLLSASALFVYSFAYYLLLGVMRFLAVITRRRADATRLVYAIGGLLMLLALALLIIVLTGTTARKPGVYGTIPMITIATFTFGKIALAVCQAVRRRGETLPLLRALGHIRYAEVAVSLLTMQRSMLLSFGGGNEPAAPLLNLFTGTAVGLFILALGLASLFITRKEKHTHG